MSKEEREFQENIGVRKYPWSRLSEFNGEKTQWKIRDLRNRLASRGLRLRSEPLPEGTVKRLDALMKVIQPGKFGWKLLTYDTQSLAHVLRHDFPATYSLTHFASVAYTNPELLHRVLEESEENPSLIRPLLVSTLVYFDNFLGFKIGKYDRNLNTFYRILSAWSKADKIVVLSTAERVIREMSDGKLKVKLSNNLGDYFSDLFFQFVDEEISVPGQSNVIDLPKRRKVKVRIEDE